MFEIHHVGIVVSDLEESVGFYCRNFGFRVVARDTNPVKKARAAMIDNGSFMIELIEYAEHLYDDIPINHVAYRVDDVERVLDRVRELVDRPIRNTKQLPGTGRLISGVDSDCADNSLSQCCPVRNIQQWL